MTDKEFRRLSRRELVEIIYELQKRLEVTQTALRKAEEALASRELKLRQAGSIAQAALGLNEVFAHAQAAADQYLEEVIRANSQADEQARQIIDEARQTAEAILRDARQESQKLMSSAQQEQDALERWLNL